METKAKRAIQSGTQYDQLFPLPKGEDITIRLDAEVNDTLALIQKTVPLTLKDTEKIAKLLKGKSLEQTCENIWDFVYNHIQYKRDKEGVEQVRRPARVWQERKTGVDCDCYTEFISSILTNLSIAHKLRITKYDHKPSYQHIYPIVPKDGNASKELNNRNGYIVIDCVKDNFDDEQPFTEFKDYNGMRLDYLNGFDDGFRNPQTTDIGDLSSLDDNKELNGKFSKWLDRSKFGRTINKARRFLNRFTNPGAIMIRNGFLLAMKTNFLKLAGQLRYAYASNKTAKALGMNLDVWEKLKKVRDKAEDIYYQVGGSKEKLMMAILKGKGNRDGKISRDGDGQSQMSGLDDVYADEQEYNIIHKGSINGLDGEDELGVVATASVTAAMTVLGAVAAALSKVKGLFPKKSPEAKQFDPQPTQGGAEAQISTNDDLPSKPAKRIAGDNENITASSDETTQQNSTQGNANYSGASMPTRSQSSRMSVDNDQALVESKNADASSANPKTEGVFTKATTWVKENPGKSLLIAGVLMGGGYLLLKKRNAARPPSPSALNGFSKKASSKKKKTTKASHKSKPRISTIDL